MVFVLHLTAETGKKKGIIYQHNSNNTSITETEHLKF